MALAGVVAVFLAVCAAVGPFHPDRSFVAYRYAENIAAGHGPVYSAGDEPGEGYGNTLWVWACAALAAAGVALPAAAPALSLLFGALSLAVLWFGLRRASSVTAALAAAGVAATSGPLAVAAMSGEGATLVALLAAGVVVLLDRAGTRRAPWMLAAAGGVLLAACGNALLAVFPAALLIRMRGLRNRPGARSAATIAAAVYLPGVLAFHVWRLSTFGSLLRHAPGFDAGWASLPSLFVSQPHDMTPFGWFYVMLFVTGLAGVLVSRSRPSGALAAGVALVAGAITLSARDPLPGLAGSAAALLLLTIPSAALVDAIPRARRSRAVDALLLCALLVTSLGWSADARVFARHLRDTHDATFVPLGRWLAVWRPGGEMLCASPGALPYYSGWRTRVITGDGSLAGSPDLVVLMSEGMFDAVIDEAQAPIAARISDDYRLLAAVRLDWTRDRAFLLYARKDVPLLTDAEHESFPNGLGSIARLNR